jgi:glycerol-3-phosphate cytidylyltransferase
MVKKYKIGYTTGVFDMFHIGHLNVLKRSKECCEHLIVGVSTDDLVQSYKNRLPIIPFEQRFAIIEACRYVDKVVSQTSMNKMDAWRQLKFDVIFHGDDWKNTEVYNNYIQEFEKIGVAVIFFPHTEGISSMELRKKVSG